MIRVMLVDDQLLFRAMLEEMLTKNPQIQVVASAADGYEAVELATLHRPDVVLLDIRMPGLTGIETLREIKEVVPTTRIVMLTTFEDTDNIRAASQWGADGYLVKDMKPEALIMAVNCVYHGLVPLHRGAYSALVAAGAEPLHIFDRRVELGDMVFDAVDIAIMRLLTEGKTNKAIAEILSYSEGTIKNRVSKMLSVTGLSDRNEIAVFAIKNQII